jgi:hypothetical protein
VADQPGIDLMRRRIERASRQAPPSRRPAEPPAGGPAAPVEVSPVPAPAALPPEAAVAPPAPVARRRASARSAAAATPVRLGADLPPVNLAIRVRKPLDDRLAEVIHQLRGTGVRTSKVELIEMLLWEMPDDEPSAIRERLRRFRDWAPRGTGAPLDAGEPGS